MAARHAGASAERLNVIPLASCQEYFHLSMTYFLVLAAETVCSSRAAFDVVSGAILCEQSGAINPCLHSGAKQYCSHYSKGQAAFTSVCRSQMRIYRAQLRPQTFEGVI
jgi:hypothetical protein